MYYDLNTKETKQVAVLKTFLRGLEIVGDYLFVGASMLREKSTSFGQLPISNDETFCGLYIFNRHTGKQMGGLSYTDKVKEIFSVKVLQNTMMPGLLTERDEYFNRCLMAEPKVNFWLTKASESED